MNRKAKGTVAERELIHMFWNTNLWAAMRAAGSGSMSFPSPDIIAGNAQRRLAIECKSVGDDAKYIAKEDVQHLLEFAQRFGAEPWIGIRFTGKKWFFVNPEDMKETEKNAAITKELAEMKGLSFHQLIGHEEQIGAEKYPPWNNSIHFQNLSQQHTEDDREQNVRSEPAELPAEEIESDDTLITNNDLRNNLI